MKLLFAAGKWWSYELSDAELNENEQDNYKDNNGKYQCHNSDNFPGQVRNTIFDDQDIGGKISSLNFN